ncbi:hypothetical protein Hanom_Chr05g00431761 [Helianthus anomalus]
MDGVNEPDENGKISNFLDTDRKKKNLWAKVAKLAKPQGRRWHCTLKLTYIVSVKIKTLGKKYLGQPTGPTQINHFLPDSVLTHPFCHLYVCVLAGLVVH